ncbi:MAG TPA: hypothetical protein VH916_01860 [Dehalococcoidia bacterium]|jgi:predicted nucleic acid-binding protein
MTVRKTPTFAQTSMAALETVRCQQQPVLIDGFAAAEQAIPLVDLPIHCREPKDDTLLACALGGRADVLVTGDRDLLVIGGESGLGGLGVLSPQGFIAMLAERSA